MIKLLIALKRYLVIGFFLLVSMLLTFSVSAEQVKIPPGVLNQIFGFCGNTNRGPTAIKYCLDEQISFFYRLDHYVNIHSGRPYLYALINKCKLRSADPYFLNVRKWYGCFRYWLTLPPEPDGPKT